MSENVFGDNTIDSFLESYPEKQDYLVTATPELLTLLGAGEVKMFENKEELYKSIQAAMSDKTVTGRVISTKDSSRMLEFNNATGKPNATCRDAFTLNKKVIELIKSEPGVAVTIEDDISDFNNEKVMVDFNSRFSAALEYSMSHTNEEFKHFKDKFEHVKEAFHEKEETPPVFPSSPVPAQIDEVLPPAIKVH